MLGKERIMENKTTMETYKELIIKMLEKIDSEEYCRQIYTVVKILTEE